METAKSLIMDKYVPPVYTSETLRELLLSGKRITHVCVEDDADIVLYKQFQGDLLEDTTVFDSIPEIETSVDDFLHSRADQWLIPPEYNDLDVLAWLGDKCTNDEQLVRVAEEYVLYSERDLVPLLKMFIYLMDYVRENNFICGVGRGSSVSSYILYLIGVHRVDSIKYNLPITDYLK